MQAIYLVCALVGGVFLVLQVMLQVVGGGAHIDGDLDHAPDGGDDFVRLLSIKTLASGALFFGLSGLAADQFGLSALPSLVIAAGAGLAAVYVLAQLMATLARLQSRGNVELENANGASGKCYLPIPARGDGAGRIHLSLQGRIVECRAVTSGDAIPTGTDVRVVAVRDTTTVEVARAER